MENIIKHLAEEVIKGNIELDSIGNFNNMYDKVKELIEQDTIKE